MLTNSRIEVGNTYHGFLIAGASGCLFHPQTDRVISRSKGDELLGGVIYQSYTGSSVEGHIAGFTPNWLSKDILWVIFDYPFIQLRCKVFFAQIPERNQKGIDFVKKLGFKEVVRIDDVYPDCGLVVTSMPREHCRWINIDCSARRIMEEARARG